MIHIFIINFPVLVSFLDKLSIEDPDRTKTNLDLLRENIEKTKIVDLYQSLIPIEIDYACKSITLLGEPFPAYFNCFKVFDSPNTYFNRLLHQLDEAKEIAESFDIYHSIFNDINVKGQ